MIRGENLYEEVREVLPKLHKSANTRQMRRNGVVVLAILIAAVFNSGTSFATAKNSIGGPCSKSGVTAKIGGTTAICTRSGSKLVWKAQKVANPSTPKPLDANSPEYKSILKNAIETYEASYSIPTALVDSDASLIALLNQAVGYIDFSTKKFVNPMSLDEFSNRFNRSDYAQSLPPAYRLAELIRFEYPCDYVTAYNQALTFLRNNASDPQVPALSYGTVQACGSGIPTFVTGKEETLADWLLHGDTGFFYLFDKNVVMTQFQEHPWMFLQASSSNYGTAVRTLSDLNWYFSGTDTLSFTTSRAWDAVAIWKKNHGIA